METVNAVWHWVLGVGLVLSILLVSIAVGLVVWKYWMEDWFDYRKARGEIFEYVKGFKHRCTGNNRFVVTVEVLQDVFREYDTNTITRVWLELINERLIQQDPHDNEWCMR